MIRSKSVLEWYARLLRRSEDPTLRRFDRLRIEAPVAKVPVFLVRKSA